MSVSLARNLSKQPGKQFENTIAISGNTRSQRGGKLSGGRTSIAWSRPDRDIGGHT